MRPVEAADELKMKESTAKRYFQQWKKLGPNFEKQYTYVRGLFKKTAPDRDRNLDLFAKTWGIPKEKLEAILTRPHGLRQLMTGKFYFPGHANTDHKLHVALELALIISNHLIKNGGEFDDVRFAFERLMKQKQKLRETEDADIKEENQKIAFARQILKAANEVEQEGRIKRDKLSEEEVNDVIRHGMETKMELKIRNLEKEYLFRIGELMAEGLTQEQAREKIYQDLIEKGDVEGAKMMRDYQEIIHSLKADDQKPPLPPSQMPPPA